MKHFLASLLLLASAGATAQDQDTTDLMDLMNLSAVTEASELQKKLNETVGAASKKALASRETPSIVSVVTRDDIQRSGARDLIDVLRLVPGFDFGADVSFVTGIALRGAWSLEGKILIMLDGHELNELMYQNVAFFNRFPIDLIHRIEIIRGPGSAIYGGTAEYGVINIITRSVTENNGLHAAMAYGTLPGTYGRTNFQAGGSKEISKNTIIDASVSWGKAILSDQDYQDLYEEESPVNLTDYTETNTLLFAAGIRSGGLSVRGMIENYETGDPVLSTQFKSVYFSARNDFRVNQKFTITPFVNYTRQRPWRQFYLEDGSEYFDHMARRIKGGVFASYDVSRRTNLIAGTEVFQDYAKARTDEEYFQGKQDVSFHLYSFYAQALIKHPFVNITGGFRVDKHNAFGAAFVPRLALTKRFGNFHFKALASGSYRAPGIDNINISTGLKPERSMVLELETGFQLTPDMLLSLNGYQIKTKDIIVFTNVDMGGGELLQGYVNNKRFGTRGIEVVYAFRKSSWSVEANYSFYKAGSSTVDRYAVPENDELFIAFPQQKFALITGYNITGDFSINLTANYFSERFAYDHLDEEGAPAVSRFAPYTLLNANLTYTNLITRGLTASIGAYDILDEKPIMPQAYNGDFAPVSGRSREFVLRIAYTLPLSK